MQDLPLCRSGLTKSIVCRKMCKSPSWIWDGITACLAVTYLGPLFLLMSCVCLTDGTRVASSTGIDLLLLDDFKLIINDVTYHVRPPKRGKPAWFLWMSERHFSSHLPVKLQHVFLPCSRMQSFFLKESSQFLIQPL